MPSKLRLSLGATPNLRTGPVLNGTVEPDGIEFMSTVLHPSELFWRQLRFAEFDVSEMSMSSLMITLANGDDRWVGLPVFTTRRLFHTTIIVRRDAGIESPADLRGKRVGVPEYQQTAALWTRGVLEHEFGVAPRDFEHWMERIPTHSHRGAAGFEPPAGVVINQIPAETNIGAMMVAGELDAVIYYIVDPESNLVDRSTVDLANHPDMKMLFPDPLAEGVRYYRKTGILHINHGMVVKRALVEEHPWAVLNILKAFDLANERVERRRIEHVEYHIATGLVSRESAEGLARPLIRHGVVANRTTLETIAQYSNEQGLTPRLATMEDLFAASTLEQ